MAIVITSNCSVRNKIGLEAKKVMRFGWDEKKLTDFAESVQKILQNFERATFNRFRFKVVVSEENYDREKELFAINKTHGVISIALEQGPGPVMEQGPSIMGRELARYMFENAKKLNLSLKVPDGGRVIESAVERIWEFYVFGRGLEIDTSALREELINLIYSNGVELKKRQIEFCVLRPHIPPQRDIEASVKDSIEAIRGKLQKTILEEKETSSWEITFKLSMLYTIAKMHKCSEAAKMSQEALKPYYGRDLAMIELLQTLQKEEAVEYFQARPAEFERQLNKAVKGHAYVFNSMLDVFEFFYKRVALG